PHQASVSSEKDCNDFKRFVTSSEPARPLGEADVSDTPLTGSFADSGSGIKKWHARFNEAPGSDPWGHFFFECCSHATACHGSERIGFVLRVGLSPQADELTLP